MLPAGHAVQAASWPVPYVFAGHDWQTATPFALQLTKPVPSWQ